MRIILLISLFLLSPFFASANVIINEVMYDLDGADRGREWIEIYNGGTEAIDLSGWKFYEGGTNHRIKTAGEGSFIVPSGAFAVIADRPEKFSADWPDYSGIIFDSSFSLKNTGEILIIKNAELGEVDKLDYVSDWGGAGDGNSLQKINGNWVGAPPTPGALNAGAALPPEEAPPSEPAASQAGDEPATEPAAPAEEEVSEPAAPEEPPISKEPETGSPAGGEKAETNPVEIKQTAAAAGSFPRGEETGGQAEAEKEKTEEHSSADGGKGAASEGVSADTKPAPKEEKSVEAPLPAFDEAAQTANVITAVSDKVRGVEDWLVLVLIIGILAGVGTLFIRG